MSEPDRFVAGGMRGNWTVEGLYQFFTRLLSEMDVRYEQRYTAQAEAIDAARHAAEAALELVRETTAEMISAAEQRATGRGDAQDATRLMLFEGIKATHAAGISNCLSHIAELDRLTEAKFVTYRTLIDSQADKVALALTASDKAVNKAELATEKRFEGVNEFRAQLADQAQRLMPRIEAETRTGQNTEKIADLAARLAELDKRLAEISSRTGGHAESTANVVKIVGVALAVITTMIGVVGLFLAFKK